MSETKTDAAGPAPRDGEPAGGIELSSYLLALGPRAVAQVVHRFLDNVADMERAMEDALERGDAAALERAAHSLKGASGTIGAARLLSICRRLEGQAERGSLTAARQALAELRREHLWIRHQLGHIPPPRRDDATEPTP